MIDEHNKQRQNLLNLEKSWATKHVWFQLLTTIAGMCVVDLHRIYLSALKHELLNSDRFHHVNIRKFADLICQPLAPNNRQITWTGNKRARTNLSSVDKNDFLNRISTKTGETNRDPTERMRNKFREKGNSFTKNCYVCRKYLNKEGNTVYYTTQWECNICQMPICGVDRSTCSDNKARKKSCLQDHLDAYHEDDPLRCVPAIKRPGKFPNKYQVPYISVNDDESTRQQRSQNDDDMSTTSTETEKSVTETTIQNNINILLPHGKDMTAITRTTKATTKSPPKKKPKQKRKHIKNITIPQRRSVWHKHVPTRKSKRKRIGITK